MGRTKTKLVVLAIAALAVTAGAVGLTLSIADSGPGLGARVVDCGPSRPAPACAPGRGLEVRARGRRLAAAWSGRFGAGGPAGWEQIQARPGSIEVAGGLARFAVRPGDTPVPSGERAEVAASAAATGGQEGREAWYVWSTRFPADFRPVEETTFNVFTQFHGTAPDRCPPNVAFQVNTRPAPAAVRLAVRGGKRTPNDCAPRTQRAWDTVQVETGRWYDFALHVRWSSDPSRGFVEFAVDERVVVPRTAMATLYPGQQVYAKQGFYREPAGHVSRVDHTGMTRLRP